MTSEFTSFLSPLGDIMVQGGSLVNLTGSETLNSVIGNNKPEKSAKYNGSLTPFSFDYPPNPSGGSGRNIIIHKTDYSGIPHGLFFPIDNNTWASTNYSNAKITYDIEYVSSVPVSHKLNIYDDTSQVVAYANIGCIPSQSMIQCSALVENGGAIPAEGLVKWVYLGINTGSVSLSYNSTIGDCRFVVEYDNIDVIDENGSGTASFSKTTSNEFAKVTVYALSDETEWDFNLGCPDDGIAPFTPPTGRTTFNTALTSYGLIITDGDNINVVCTYEGVPSIKKCLIIPSYLDRSTPDTEYIEMVSDGFARYYDNTNNDKSIILSQSGCNFIDNTDIIAIKEVPDLGFDVNVTDPSGIYVSTAYGQENYGGGDPFTFEVKMIDVSSLDLVHYFALYYSSDVYVDFDGPISSINLPSNTNNIKYYPVSNYKQANDNIVDLSSGTVPNTDLVKYDEIEVSLCYNNVEKVGKIQFRES